MSTARLLPLLAVMALGLGACKVSAGGGTNPDQARPNTGEGDAQAPDGGGETPEEDGETPDGGGASSAAAGGGFVAAEGGGEASQPSDSPCPEGVSPGDSYKDDCNTCRCTDDGKAMCTRMMCKAGEDGEDGEDEQPPQ